MKPLKYYKMENDVLRVKAVLHDLQRFATKENEISSLTILNELISSSQEEVEFLYNSDGIDVVISFLESDNKLTNICLKILANASKRYEKIRSKLLENNIFQLLAIKLKSETDFSNSNLLLYSALIVVLLQGNYEAQNQMRTSGCLSSMLYILSCILDEVQSKPLPFKTTELIIYAIIASNKEPRHTENQTEIGWITPKILEYLGKHIVFSGSGHLQIIKCFWLFLKIALDRNELNQQIFLNSSGLSVLFRNIQSVVEEGNYEVMDNLLVKMTAVLVRFKSNREFLYQASSYCPVMILNSLLKTRNTLVIQQTIIFLDSLAQEFPKALQIMRDNNILRRMKRAKLFLLKNSLSAEPSQNFSNSMNILDQTQASQKDQIFNSKLHFDYNLKIENEEFRQDTKQLDLETRFCVVHDVDLNFQNTLEPFVNSSVEKLESKGRVQTLSRFSGGNLIFRRKELTKKKRKLRKIISQKFSGSSKNNGNRFNIIGSAVRRIMYIFRSFLSFFHECESENFKNSIEVE